MIYVSAPVSGEGSVALIVYNQYTDERGTHPHTISILR